jgi:hypothetical protein
VVCFGLVVLVVLLSQRHLTDETGMLFGSQTDLTRQGHVFEYTGCLKIILKIIQH